MPTAKSKAAPKAAAKPKVTVPKLKLFEVTAVIPTVQYGNIQPKYSIEAETFEQAQEAAMPYIEKLWAQYCAAGSELPKKEVIKEVVAAAPAGQLVKLESHFTENFAWFDPISHRYTLDAEGEGNGLLSGSTFAKKFERPFPKDEILKMMEEKYEIPREDIADMWQLKSEISTGFGTAIHAALELYGKYARIGAITGKNKGVNTALHDHPIIQAAVEDFFRNRMNEDAEYEVFVLDEELGLCGQIDRLRIVNREKKIVRIQDYKTNANIDKPVQMKRPFDHLKTEADKYRLQLSFYAYILQKKGWKVEGLDVIHWNGRWSLYQSDVIDVSKHIKEVLNAN